ncbi:Phage protein OS=Lysinibacillus sphaericus OX=1421 GN=LS41612_21190 PE=4 SV=1 [Lysinibacillus sphaericus]
MSKFAWLKDYRELEYEIAYLDLNLERTKTELKRWVQGDLAKVKLTSESQGSKVEDIIEQIEWELAI